MIHPRRVNLVSSFGRGETLALALNENGFEVRIVDFSGSYPAEYQRGSGPFPIVKKDYIAAQREYLKALEPVPQGLTFWMKDGPMELSGPMSSVHIHSHPEIQTWKTNSAAGDFSRQWLTRFLEHWPSAYAWESWQDEKASSFPAESAIGVLPSARETQLHSFERARAKGIEIHTASGLKEVRFEKQRLTEIEIETGTVMAIGAEQWIWCLSSHETSRLGETAAAKVFTRGVRAPEWGWLSFTGHCLPGRWREGIPTYSLMISDPFLPWTYANAAVLRFEAAENFRVWIKVPLARVQSIDTRREWALEIEKNLSARLSFAQWKVDPSNWILCPHSEIYAPETRSEARAHWKNWDWISAENLPRLDLSARFEREAQAFRRLIHWRDEQKKKEGARRDQALHAP